MKRILIFLVSMAWVTYSWAQTPVKEQGPALYQCVSQETGIAFGCDPNWKLNRIGKKLKVMINETPRIEMDIEENDQTLHFMSEFSRDALASLGRYEEGFDIKRIPYCNREAVKVSGYLKGSPDTSVLDYFMLDHQNIHSVKFTAHPKEAMENYEILIKRIVETINFTKHKPGIKFITEQTQEPCADLVSNERNGT